MPKGRLEAFSDGVIAIIITIMVLEISAPDGASPADLLSLSSSFKSYALSFLFVGVYWNNHHHLLNLVNKVGGRMLWANLLFLFALSLVPVATDWIDKTGFAAFPTVVYVVLSILVSLAYMLLETVVRRSHCPSKGQDTAPSIDLTPQQIALIKRRSTAKERWTLVFEAVSLALSLVLPTTRLAYVALLLALCLWVVPDLRIVHVLDWLASEEDQEDSGAGED